MIKNIIQLLDNLLNNFSKKYAAYCLMGAFSFIYIWFGFLKIIDKSPIEEVVRLSTFFIPVDNFPLFLGIWEMLIGVLFMFRKTLKLGVILFLLKIPGTFLPLVFVSQKAFINAPFEPTLVGQYIFKNLILIPAALWLYKEGS